MNVYKGLLSLGATVAIAAVVAYSVSAPRNVDNFMNEEQASLGGNSINEEIASAQAEAKAAQCDAYSQAAREAWDRSLEQGTTDRDAARLDELDRQVDRFC